MRRPTGTCTLSAADTQHAGGAADSTTVVQLTTRPQQQHYRSRSRSEILTSLRSDEPLDAPRAFAACWFSADAPAIHVSSDPAVPPRRALREGGCAPPEPINILLPRGMDERVRTGLGSILRPLLPPVRVSRLSRSFGLALSRHCSRSMPRTLALEVPSSFLRAAAAAAAAVGADSS